VASLAELLDYDQRKKQMLQGLVDYASNQYKLGSAFGEGLSDQAKGLAQMVMHPIDTATQMYQGGKAVVQNPKAALQAAKEGLTEAVSSPENIARFAGQNFSPTDIANALNKVGTMRELTVYHGTPHKFENFDASKIGTGEGQQAYGHGIYVTESPEVAKKYQEELSSYPQRAAEHAISQYGDIDEALTKTHQKVAHYKRLIEEGGGGDINKAKQFLKLSEMQLEGIRGIIQERPANKGSFLTVDLPDEKIDLMLDWNKPLAEQKNVMSKLENHWNEKFGDADIVKQRLGLDENSEGSDLALALGMGRNPETAKSSSLMMQSLGIPGIKYRSYDRVPKKGETYNPKHNYVVFPGEEQNLKILKRE